MGDFVAEAAFVGTLRKVEFKEPSTAKKHQAVTKLVFAMNCKCTDDVPDDQRGDFQVQVNCFAGLAEVTKDLKVGQKYNGEGHWNVNKWVSDDGKVHSSLHLIGHKIGINNGLGREVTWLVIPETPAAAEKPTEAKAKKKAEPSLTDGVQGFLNRQPAEAAPGDAARGGVPGAAA